MNRKTSDQEKRDREPRSQSVSISALVYVVSTLSKTRGGQTCLEIDENMYTLHTTEFQMIEVDDKSSNMTKICTLHN